MVCVSTRHYEIYSICFVKLTQCHRDQIASQGWLMNPSTRKYSCSSPLLNATHLEVDGLLHWLIAHNFHATDVTPCGMFYNCILRHGSVSESAFNLILGPGIVEITSATSPTDDRGYNHIYAFLNNSKASRERSLTRPYRGKVFTRWDMLQKLMALYPNIDIWPYPSPSFYPQYLAKPSILGEVITFADNCGRDEREEIVLACWEWIRKSESANTRKYLARQTTGLRRSITAYEYDLCKALLGESKATDTLYKAGFRPCVLETRL